MNTPTLAHDVANATRRLYRGTSVVKFILSSEDTNNALSIINSNWKYIEPNNGPAINTLTAIELGNDPAPQLYNLTSDLGEKNNVAEQNKEKVKELSILLQKIKDAKANR